MKSLLRSVIVTVLIAPAVAAQVPRPPDATRALEIKYVRDSAEYATLCRMVYRMATETATKSHPAGVWGVILDVDETTLDNSTYQIERSVYGLPYDEASWSNWVARAEAGTVPGVKDFLDAVRRIGGRVAFITDRNAEYVAPDGTKFDLVKATRDNLERNQLLGKDDLLCLKTGAADTKTVRRRGVREGSGPCSWSGVPVQVIVFAGDQMTDFPAPGEGFTGGGTDREFGHSFFLLPQPMYGRWTNAVTRLSGAFIQ